MEEQSRQKQLRIVIAEDHQDLRNYLIHVLKFLGHEIAFSARDGAELVEGAAHFQPDLVIADIAMPIVDGIRASEQIWRRAPTAIVLISAHYAQQLIDRAQLDHVMAYLTKPFTKNELADVITSALSRFAQFQRLRQESASDRIALRHRRIVELAKVHLARSAELDEDAAFARLEEIALRQKQLLVEVARQINSTVVSPTR